MKFVNEVGKKLKLIFMLYVINKIRFKFWITKKNHNLSPSVPIIPFPSKTTLLTPNISNGSSDFQFWPKAMVRPPDSRQTPLITTLTSPQAKSAVDDPAFFGHAANVWSRAALKAPPPSQFKAPRDWIPVGKLPGCGCAIKPTWSKRVAQKWGGWGI